VYVVETTQAGSESCSFWVVVTYAIWHFYQVADVLNYHACFARAVFVRLKSFRKGHIKALFFFLHERVCVPLSLYTVKKITVPISPNDQQGSNVCN